MMLSTSWTGGGTDYGGCAGRHAAFTPQTGYNYCDVTTYYEPNFWPDRSARGDGRKIDYGRRCGDARMGIFGTRQREHGVRRDSRRHLEHDHDRRVAAHRRRDSRQQGRLGHRRPGDAIYDRRMFAGRAPSPSPTLRRPTAG